jgi:hypothetical protein
MMAGHDLGFWSWREAGATAAAAAEEGRGALRER